MYLFIHKHLFIFVLNCVSFNFCRIIFLSVFHGQCSYSTQCSWISNSSAIFTIDNRRRARLNGAKRLKVFLRVHRLFSSIFFFVFLGIHKSHTYFDFRKTNQFYKKQLVFIVFNGISIERLRFKEKWRKSARCILFRKFIHLKMEGKKSRKENETGLSTQFVCSFASIWVDYRWK